MNKKEKCLNFSLIQTHVVVEILLLVVAENVGVNGYENVHDIHQPNVT